MCVIVLLHFGLTSDLSTCACGWLRQNLQSELKFFREEIALPQCWSL